VKITEASMIAGNPASLSVLPVFGLMFVGVTLIVLLACANTGNLLVARSVARRREIEVRRALGASRARIVRQLLTESLLLSLGAAAVGLALAWRLPTFVVGRMVSRNGEFPPVELTPDLAVLGYALTLAALTSLAFGLAPALYGTRGTARETRLPLRSILLSVQVAISAALLIGAGLLVESIQRVHAHDSGFSTRDVAVVSIALPPGSYDRARIRSFSERLMRELRGRAQLRPFALTAYEPLSNSLWGGAVRLPGEDSTHEREVATQAVSTGYFDVLRIPILAGRDFGPTDTIRSILVNETMARQLWGEANPVGKTA
jgi:hypothetical protein